MIGSTICYSVINVVHYGINIILLFALQRLAWRFFKRTDEQEEIGEFFKARTSSAWMKHKVRTVYWLLCMLSAVLV